MNTNYIWIIVAVAIIGYLLYRFTKKEGQKIEEEPEKTATSEPDFSSSDVKEDFSKPSDTDEERPDNF